MGCRWLCAVALGAGPASCSPCRRSAAVTATQRGRALSLCSTGPSLAASGIGCRGGPGCSRATAACCGPAYSGVRQQHSVAMHGVHGVLGGLCCGFVCAQTSAWLPCWMPAVDGRPVGVALSRATWLSVVAGRLRLSLPCHAAGCRPAAAQLTTVCGSNMACCGACGFGCRRRTLAAMPDGRGDSRPVGGASSSAIWLSVAAGRRLLPVCLRPGATLLQLRLQRCAAATWGAGAAVPCLWQDQHGGHRAGRRSD